MHELGVTFHIMDHLEKVAKENEVEKIRKVVLELGEVSTVIESYLLNCWTWAAKKRPLFEEAELIVETLPAITYCEECEKTYSTIEYGKICPHCGSEHTYLLQGVYVFSDLWRNSRMAAAWLAVSLCRTGNYE